MNKPKLRFTKWGSEILAKPTKSVSEEYIKSAEFKDNVKRMIELSNTDGMVGLAANQVGIPMRFAIITIKPTSTRPDLKAKPTTVIINPEIIEMSSELTYGWEGCFSGRGLFFYVPRSKWIRVKYLDEEGKSITRKVDQEGHESKIFQHEIDHLDGKYCGEQVLVINGSVPRGAIITEDEYRKDTRRIPPGLNIPESQRD